MTHILPTVFRVAATGRVGCLASTVCVRCNYTHIDHAVSMQFKLSHRVLPHHTSKEQQPSRIKVPSNFREVYPEFLPDPAIIWRNKLREKLERMDMLNRRKQIDIPEFYVGSIMAVVVGDPNATGKTNRFVGICIDRGGTGLRAWFQLRNVVDHQGIEIKYEMYCPVVQCVEVLRLEKRLDTELYYLRDALPEYSTFPEDMVQEKLAEGVEVPVNPLKVKLKPEPWHKQWNELSLNGFESPVLVVGRQLTTDQRYHRAEYKKHAREFLKYDLVYHYRATIPEEEQEAVFRDVAPHYPAMVATQRQIRRKKLYRE